MAVENRYRIKANTKRKMFGEIPAVTANDNVIFEVDVYDDSVLYPLLSGYTFQLVSQKLSGKSVIRQGQLEGNKIVFELGTSEMLEPGKVEATVQIRDSNMKRISAAKFDYRVNKDPSMSGGLPTDDKTLVIANESLMLDAIDKSKQSMARVDELISKVPQPSEVVDARGGEVNLKTRLDKVSSSLADKAKKTETINATTDIKGSMDVANFAGQTLGSSAPIGNTFHHYTDGIMTQMDNVGAANTILTLKNANNPVRRPDKPANFVGSGKFLALHEHDAVAGYAKEMFYLSKDAEFVWTGVKGIATLIQNKADDGIYGFRLKFNNAHANLFDIINGVNQVLYVINSATKTRVDFVTPATQTNGLWLETKAGDINLTTIATQKVKANGNTVQTIKSGTTANRPTANIQVGEFYFDTTLNKPIWRNANNNGWVDATGATV